MNPTPSPAPDRSAPDDGWEVGEDTLEELLVVEETHPRPPVWPARVDRSRD